MSTPTHPKRASKYDERIKIDASPEAVVKSLFNGKPKRNWRYLKKNQRVTRTVKK